MVYMDLAAALSELPLSAVETMRMQNHPLTGGHLRSFSLKVDVSVINLELQYDYQCDF